MAPKAGSPAFIAFGGFFALAAAMGIGRFVYTPILPFMAAAVPLGPAEAGLIASANFLGYLVGALAASFGFFAGQPSPLVPWRLGAQCRYHRRHGGDDGDHGVCLAPVRRRCGERVRSCLFLDPGP